MRPARTLVCLCALTAVAAAPVPRFAPPASPVVRVDAKADTMAEDTDFLFQMGLMEGHLLIGHELLQAKRPELALPHFGHPVREIYDNITDYLQAHHFPAFDKQLAVLEASVASAPASADTEAKYQAIIVTLHKARELTPATLRASIPENIKMCADTIDAASGEFNEALERGKVANTVEYHDSRGYLEYAGRQIQALMASTTDPHSQSMLAQLRTILAKAEWIVEPLIPDPTPRASVGEFRAVAKQALDLGKTGQKAAN